MEIFTESRMESSVLTEIWKLATKLKENRQNLSLNQNLSLYPNPIQAMNLVLR